VVEAFPTSFLGVMIENPEALTVKRSNRSDVYFDFLACTRQILSTYAALQSSAHSDAEISKDFKANGSTEVDDDAYRALAANKFADWNSAVSWESRSSCLWLSSAPCRRAPRSRRHDCVEG
jgi:hypothetical protein